MTPAAAVDTQLIVERVQAVLPHLLAAAAILAAGWALATLLRLLARRLIGRIRGSARWLPIERQVQASGWAEVAVDVVTASVFWVVLLFAFAVAAEVLGLAAIPLALGWVARFVPSIVAAVLILVAGLTLAGIARDAVVRTATTADLTRPELLGRLTRDGLLGVAVLVALEQLGIDSALLIVGAGVALGATVGSLSLAFGLGARGEAANIISSHYLSHTYQVGQRIRFGDTEGRIIEFKVNGLVLDTHAGRLLVPGALLSTQTSLLPDGE